MAIRLAHQFARAGGDGGSPNSPWRYPPPCGRSTWHGRGGNQLTRFARHHGYPCPGWGLAWHHALYV